MFILTLETNNHKEIAKKLKEISREISELESDTLGEGFEWVTLDQQPFITMGKFLLFRKCGNKLRKRK